MILDLIAPFLVGFVGSLHCLGMCGPLVLAYSLSLKGTDRRDLGVGTSSWSNGLSHHMVFHAGRILTYGALGALVAGLFHMADLSGFFKNLRGSVTLLGGVLMVLLGLFLLKLLRLPCWFTPSLVNKPSFRGRSFHSLLHSDRSGSKIALGLATGFLPCGLSWAMMVKAATTQTIAGGFLTMAAFGLGTAPALLLTGLSASLLSLKIRVFGERAAGLSIVAMGLILLFKGARTFV
jgi:uncharacterized protein